MNSPRDCYAITTLIEEVESVFPEIGCVTSDRNGWGVALCVTFDLTSLDVPDRTPAAQVFDLLDSDERVHMVIIEDDAALVSMVGRPSVYDGRAPFHFRDAYTTLVKADQ